MTDDTKPTIGDIERAMDNGKHVTIKLDGAVSLSDSPPRPPRPTIAELDRELAASKADDKREHWAIDLTFRNRHEGWWPQDCRGNPFDYARPGAKVFAVAFDSQETRDAALLVEKSERTDWEAVAIEALGYSKHIRKLEASLRGIISLRDCAVRESGKAYGSCVVSDRVYAIVERALDADDVDVCDGCGQPNDETWTGTWHWGPGERNLCGACYRQPVNEQGSDPCEGKQHRWKPYGDGGIEMCARCACKRETPPTESPDCNEDGTTYHGTPSDAECEDP